MNYKKDTNKGYENILSHFFKTIFVIKKSISNLILKGTINS